MKSKNIEFSSKGYEEIELMYSKVLQMLKVAMDALISKDRTKLVDLATFEESIDKMKKELISNHFARLAEGDCRIEVSPYYSSMIVGLERVADHLVNVGYSIDNPIGSQNK